MPSSCSDDDDDDDAMLLALAPTEHERRLLATVSDAVLQDKLLLLVLRAEIGVPLQLFACPSMHMSDSFCQFNIEVAVKQTYVAVELERKRESPPLFALSCPSAPAINMVYDGDDSVQDKLIEFFCKDLLRFEDNKVRCPHRAQLVCSSSLSSHTSLYAVCMQTGGCSGMLARESGGATERAPRT